MAETSAFWDAITSPKSIGIIGAGVGIAILGAMHHIGADSITEIELATEEATSAFGLLSGIGGALAQIISGKRLGDSGKRRITVGRLFVPAFVSIIGTAGSAFLIRTS